ncbi:hypothetical protein ACFU44_16640 [Nocardia rhizosphaerihabitans]
MTTPPPASSEPVPGGRSQTGVARVDALLPHPTSLDHQEQYA